MDWIDLFLDYTSEAPSPEIFRLWAAIGAVSGALERRVWVQGKVQKLYPSMYILLVGPPASGKTQAIVPATNFWREFHDTLYVAPNSVTRASLLDELEKASRKLLIHNRLVEYHSLLVCPDEFGVLLSAYDLEILSVINELYECKGIYQESRRHNKKYTEIIKPHMTILAGSQPAFLQSLLPDEAWGMGFTSRLTMIYSAQEITSDILGEDDHDFREDTQQALKGRMHQMLDMYGQFRVEKEAALRLRAWTATRYEPRPHHSKLEHYNGRRGITCMKLAQISAASRNCEMIITEFDFLRAQKWLLDAEVKMPDIFRAMSGKSDAEIIKELHFFMWQIWARDNKPIPGTQLYFFLSTKAPSDKIPRILDTALKSGYIKKIVNQDNYIPKPQADFGVE